MNKGNIKILAVADKTALSTIQNICQEEYLDLTTETSPLKAGGIIKSVKFDIFIIAYEMPGMNGINLLKRIRQLYKEDSYIPIFCCASNTILNQFRKEQRELLFHYFLEIPINLNLGKSILKKAIMSVEIRRVSERIRRNEKNPG